jgi:hypothetical protein
VCRERRLSRFAEYEQKTDRELPVIRLRNQTQPTKR